MIIFTWPHFMMGFWFEMLRKPQADILFFCPEYKKLIKNATSHEKEP